MSDCRYSLPFLIIILSVFTTSLFAQDTLFLDYGEKKVVHVKEINPDFIIYNDSVNGQLTLKNIPKSQVVGIKFSDGIYESYLKLNSNSQPVKLKFDTTSNVYNLGRYNALRYYHSTPVFLSSLFMMTAGAALLDIALPTDEDLLMLSGPAFSIALFASPTSPPNLGTTDRNLLTSPEY